MLSERMAKEQNIITIALDQLPKTSLEYLRGLAEGIRLAREENNKDKDKKEAVWGR